MHLFIFYFSVCNMEMREAVVAELRRNTGQELTQKHQIKLALDIEVF